MSKTWSVETKFRVETRTDRILDQSSRSEDRSKGVDIFDLGLSVPNNTFKMHTFHDLESSVSLYNKTKQGWFSRGKGREVLDV